MSYEPVYMRPEQISTLKEHTKNVNFPPNYLTDLDFYVQNYKYPLAFNCYAYAMQFNVPFSMYEYYYQPGFLSGYVPRNGEYNIDAVINGFINDCRFLGLSYEDSSLQDCLYDDAYKIAILFRPNREYDNDFHFVRQNNDSSWSEKGAWDLGVKLVDDPNKNKTYKLMHVMKISRNR